MNKKIETYTAVVICENCNFNGHIEVNKGALIENHKCPNCGCTKLYRNRFDKFYVLK